MSAQDWLGLAAVLVGFAGLAFIGFELRQQRQVAGYVAYQGVTQQYSDLLWASADHPDLDAVWDSLDSDRIATFSKGQTDEALTWGAWNLMDSQDRRFYRVVRRAIDIFEQAHFACELGWVGPDTSAKWDEGIVMWSKSPYFKFAWQDAQHLLRPSFVLHVNHLLGSAVY